MADLESTKLLVIRYILNQLNNSNDSFTVSKFNDHGSIHAPLISLYNILANNKAQLTVSFVIPDTIDGTETPHKGKTISINDRGGGTYSVFVRVAGGGKKRRSHSKNKKSKSKSRSKSSRSQSKSRSKSKSKHGGRKKSTTRRR
jgi:hypothetical protein